MNMIKEIQAELGLTVDGVAGTKTWTAIHEKICTGVVTTPDVTAPADERSEKNILTLLPEVQPFARALIQRAAQNGITIKVISGTRSYMEQDALYAIGRTAPGAIVTKARAGYSNHNFGIAFDIGVFEGTSYLRSGDKYNAVGILGEQLGLEWGGRWESMLDLPHYQLRPHWAKGVNEMSMLKELRRRALSQLRVFTEE